MLRAEGITKNFGGVSALTNVDFSVDKGECVGLIGPNGSGKTTLFSIMSGFLQPDSGHVLWDERQITTLSTQRRAGLGLLRTFQEIMVFPSLTVRENLDVVARASRLSLKRDTRTLAAHSGLLSVLDRDARDLSWGQTRLLGIALALALEPKMLLLDEPFAGLSPIALADVREVIQRLRAQGMCLCIIEHDMPSLLPLCDRLVVLENGHVIANGTPQGVIDDEGVRRAYLGAGHASG